MASVQPGSAPETESTDAPGPLRALGRIWTRPRETMAQLLRVGSRPRLEAALWTLGLASEQWGQGEAGIALPGSTWKALALVAGAALAVLAALYVMAFFVRGTARLLGGRTTGPRARAALAWGMVPHVWALLYRLPRLWLGVWPPAPFVRIDSAGGALTIHWSTLSPLAVAGQIGLGLADAGVALAGLVILAKCIGEACGLSAWRGFGAWLLAIMAVGAIATVGVVAGVALFIALLR
jgi:Yip1 domain